MKQHVIFVRMSEEDFDLVRAAAKEDHRLPGPWAAVQLVARATSVVEQKAIFDEARARELDTRDETRVRKDLAELANGKLERRRRKNGKRKRKPKQAGRLKRAKRASSGRKVLAKRKRAASTRARRRRK